MEIGECSVAEEDGKPSASPQHLTTTTRRLDDDVGSATAESGIVSLQIVFVSGWCTVRYWMSTVLLVSVPRCTILSC